MIGMMIAFIVIGAIIGIIYGYSSGEDKKKGEEAFVSSFGGAGCGFVAFLIIGSIAMAFLAIAQECS